MLSSHGENVYHYFISEIMVTGIDYMDNIDIICRKGPNDICNQGSILALANLLNAG